MLILSIATGVSVLVLFVALIVPLRGKPRHAKATLQSAHRVRLVGVQSYLDRAQIEISASEYMRRSLTLGIPLGLGLFILIGSVILLGVGVTAGFLITWTKLEQERDRKLVRYTKQLAGACDTIRTAYGVNPSLKKALEAVATYGQSPVKEDFQDILVAASQERFAQGLQVVGDRRRSIVFDTVAASLVRASEATGEVGDMLQRLAESTRQNVAAFEEALTSQINARSSIQWGTYGPWLIFCVFRCMTLLLTTAAGANLFAPMMSFFGSLMGNMLTLAAALITIGVYRYCLGVSQRGLVVRRVATAGVALRSGQKPLAPGLAPQSPESALSAQSRPVTVN
jgi:hypothetical protein